MAAMNSIVLACNYVISGSGSSGLNAKLALVPSLSFPVVCGDHRLPVIRAQQQAKLKSPMPRNRVAVKEQVLLCCIWQLPFSPQPLLLLEMPGSSMIT
ncbi:hypothetical protein V6N13_126717 [Hibiscus sabdariffa]|uniref:Uncharacterized protein n=1 Tax=Hibiscus sabdariffa TaxID=183260 RepID=A0ABR2REN1_9ROSI